MMRALLLFAFSFMAALVPAHPSWAQNSGQVAYLSGTLMVKKPDGSSRLLTEKSEISNGDTLSTAQDSYARLKFVDGSEIALRPNTTLQVSDIRYKSADKTSDRFVVSLLKGGMRAVTGLIAKENKQNVSYNTPVAYIGIRGTHFGAMFCQNDDCKGLQTLGGTPLRNGLYADVADGSIDMANQAGKLVVETGQFAYVADANTAPQLVNERDGFRVRLPFSVMFDDNAQLWSEGGRCNACVLH